MNIRRSYWFGAAWVLVWTVATLVNIRAQNETSANDAVARLQRKLDNGSATLDYRPGSGYLPGLLQLLGVKVESQVLVFSKTSFQQALISPQNPRAVYFNDSVSVGTVPGGEVYELLAVEPGDGLTFYTFSTKQTDRPRFQRRGIECLFCHGPGNKGAPALMVASVVPDAEGRPAYTGAFIRTLDHTTPFADRWGGWYVTGTHGSQRHMGNAFAPDPERPFDLDQTGSQNLTTLEGRIDATKYLTPSSDIVALMTLEHQVGMVNRMNAVAFQYRHAERTGAVTDADWKRLDAEIDDLVGYMLFVDESPLAEPVQGTSAFTKVFAAAGPRDRNGRSLRDFDLERRLFRYPLSYLIYSELFDSMPSPVRHRVYQKLYNVLTGKDTSGKFASLSDLDRRAVLEIVTETKTNLPPSWMQ
jgi:hypothetical protein